MFPARPCRTLSAALTSDDATDSSSDRLCQETTHRAPAPSLPHLVCCPDGRRCYGLELRQVGCPAGLRLEHHLHSVSRGRAASGEDQRPFNQVHGKAHKLAMAGVINSSSRPGNTHPPPSPPASHVLLKALARRGCDDKPPYPSILLPPKYVTSQRLARLGCDDTPPKLAMADTAAVTVAPRRRMDSCPGRSVGRALATWRQSKAFERRSQGIQNALQGVCKAFCKAVARHLYDGD